MKITQTILIGSMIALGFTACIKHEIIPAPEPKVELLCHFKGMIHGSPLELTQNVKGYTIETNKSITVPPFSLALATYYSGMKSSEDLVAIKISIGSMFWDGNGSDGPPSNVFNSYFTNNLTPLYAAGAITTPTNPGGVEVSYRDGVGNIWLSKETDNATNTMVFSNISQETDKTGDYSKYIAKFNCTVYHTFRVINQHPAPTPNDTVYNEMALDISDAVLKGWFKR